MLTLITGTPGAGKSLYSVWELARHVPGSTIENGQTPVKRTLYSNVKGLLIEHEHITADDLNDWHNWAKPGDVILFDEVQEVWRPRGISNKVPECIAKLETHRHMGVDLILVTQHPMLLDQNIRRLVNQHLHLRRISKTVAMVYEWDHCSNPGTTKTCVNSRVWFHPKKAYALYKSAQLHTKPKTRIPGVAYIGLLALAGFAYAGPAAYQRAQTTFGGAKPQTEIADAKPKTNIESIIKDGQLVTTQTQTFDVPPVSNVDQGPGNGLPPAAPQIAGCIKVKDRCGCMDPGGRPVTVEPGYCADLVGTAGKPLEFPDSPAPRILDAAEVDALQFAFHKKQ